MTGTQFIWLIHWVFCGFYVFEMGRNLHYRKKYPEIYQLYKDEGWSLTQKVFDHKLLGTAMAVVAAHNVFWFMAFQQVNPALLSISCVGGLYFGIMNEIVSPLTKDIDKRRRFEKNHAGRDNFMGGDADDDEAFSYQGSGKSRSKAQADAPNSNGTSHRRHVDDAKFWAVVDSPESSDNERRKAFDCILRANAKRQKRGGDVVPT